jgi:hypothetical protein
MRQVLLVVPFRVRGEPAAGWSAVGPRRRWILLSARSESVSVRAVLADNMGVRP